MLRRTFKLEVRQTRAFNNTIKYALHRSRGEGPLSSSISLTYNISATGGSGTRGVPIEVYSGGGLNGNPPIRPAHTRTPAGRQRGVAAIRSCKPLETL